MVKIILTSDSSYPMIVRIDNFRSQLFSCSLLSSLQIRKNECNAIVNAVSNNFSKIIRIFPDEKFRDSYY